MKDEYYKRKGGLRYNLAYNLKQDHYIYILMQDENQDYHITYILYITNLNFKNLIFTKKY